MILFSMAKIILMGWYLHLNRLGVVFHYEASEVIFEFPEQNRTKLSCNCMVGQRKINN